MEALIPDSLRVYLRTLKPMIKDKNVRQMLKYQNAFILNQITTLKAKEIKLRDFLFKIKILCFLPPSSCEKHCANITSQRHFYKHGESSSSLALPLFVQRLSDQNQSPLLYEIVIALLVGFLTSYQLFLPMHREIEFVEDTRFLLETAQRLKPILHNKIYKLMFQAASSALSYLRYDTDQIVDLSHQALAFCFKSAPEELKEDLVSQGLKMFFRKSIKHPYLKRKKMKNLEEDKSYLLMSRMLEFQEFNLQFFKVLKHEAQRNGALSFKGSWEGRSVSMRDKSITKLLGLLKERKPDKYWEVWEAEFFPMMPFHLKHLKAYLQNDLVIYCEKSNSLLRLGMELLKSERQYMPLMTLITGVKSNIHRVTYPFIELLRFALILTGRLQRDPRPNLRRNAYITFRAIIQHLWQRERAPFDDLRLQRLCRGMLNNAYRFYKTRLFRLESAELLETISLLIHSPQSKYLTQRFAFRSLKQCMALLKQPTNVEMMFRQLSSCCLLKPSFVENYHNLCYFFSRERVAYFRQFIECIIIEKMGGQEMVDTLWGVCLGLQEKYHRIISQLKFGTAQMKAIQKLLHFLKVLSDCAPIFRERILLSLEKGLLLLLENLQDDSEAHLNLTNQLLQFYATFQVNSRSEIVPLASDELILALEKYMLILKEPEFTLDNINLPSLNLIQNLTKTYLVSKASPDVARELHLHLIRTIKSFFNAQTPQSLFAVLKTFCMVIGLMDVAHQMFTIKLPKSEQPRNQFHQFMISDARFSYITSHANYLGLYFVLASFVFANPAYSSILLPCLSRFSLYPVHIMKPEFAYEVKPTLLSLYKFLIDRYIPLQEYVLYFKQMCEWHFNLENFTPKLRAESTPPQFMEDFQELQVMLTYQERSYENRDKMEWVRLCPQVQALRGDPRYPLIGPHTAAYSIVALFEQLFAGYIFKGHHCQWKYITNFIRGFCNSKEIESMGMLIREFNEPLVVLERVFARLSIIFQRGYDKESPIFRIATTHYVTLTTAKMLGKLFRPALITIQDQTFTFLVWLFRHLVITHLTENDIFYVIMESIPFLLRPSFKRAFTRKNHKLCYDYHLRIPDWMQRLKKKLNRRKKKKPAFRL